MITFSFIVSGCYRYPASITPAPNGDKLESPAFDRDCANIFPETVYDKLKLYMQGRPLVISGILYNDQDQFSLSLN